MKRCQHCNVAVVGQVDTCPLCQCSLDKTGEPSQDIFPSIPTIYHQYSFLLRLVLFISVVIAVASTAINFMFTQSGWWSLFVLGGIACLWISLYFIIQKRANISKTITYQVILISLFSVVWDALTGWRGWSIDYVIPIVCASSMLTVGIITKVKKVPKEDYMIYFVLEALFGIIPIIFFLTGILNTVYPSLICIALSLIFFAALFIFTGPSIIAELKKRLHL
ncbi:DUF6320 domain-containing protein [Paludicola sp. MB14-C6]|uniref:DUF6320 domain-containing protein n=1 Tax=Paludihabitans sp. MB14-C6 TaxID=3070656 RepID=UPI0027DC8BA6|nr:DUF6320 domain-containing protein [Paludicola sp. MB14-C6]WMJ21920.1 DUF6320 domain-containing protein [Paludicola sp. MB14-C6]